MYVPYPQMCGKQTQVPQKKKKNIKTVQMLLQVTERYAMYYMLDCHCCINSN